MLNHLYTHKCMSDLFVTAETETQDEYAAEITKEAQEEKMSPADIGMIP